MVIVSEEPVNDRNPHLWAQAPHCQMQALLPGFQCPVASGARGDTTSTPAPPQGRNPPGAPGTCKSPEQRHWPRQESGRPCLDLLRQVLQSGPIYPPTHRHTHTHTTHPSLFSCCLCLVTRWCPILCNPMDCSPPGSSVHGILQARILEWVAISFSRGYSQPRDRTQVSCMAGGFFPI